MSTETAVMRWQRLHVRSLSEVSRAVDALVARMVAEEYSDREIFGMRLALEEAIVNAIKHGHGGDETLRVRIGFHVTSEETLAWVEDQGPGFDPTAVPDPLAFENLERPSGRGLLLMAAYLTWVRHNERGNIITLCQTRGAHVDI
jgi:serine/threonine-protein kinase RsbW